MFDFRYHAASLAAVFMALLVGLLLGVAIGDANLVSSAEKHLRSSLQSDLNSARTDSSQLRNQLSRRAQFESSAFPALVTGRLGAQRIGLVFLGSPSDQIDQLVRRALEPSGAQLVLVAVVAEPLALHDIAGAATRSRYAQLATAPGLLRPFGVRIGDQLAKGGMLLQQVSGALLSSVDGTLEPLDGVVLVRAHGTLAPADEQAVDQFESGLASGFEQSGVPVVGVETGATNPTQIPWYERQGLASVDDLDDLAGATALDWALAGRAHGAYGLKPSAESVLPPVPAPAGKHGP